MDVKAINFLDKIEQGESISLASYLDLAGLNDKTYRELVKDTEKRLEKTEDFYLKTYLFSITSLINSISFLEIAASIEANNKQS